MQDIRVELTIDAPLAKVFSTIADSSQFSKAVPHITKVEMLSGISKGVGTRFRETRVMKGRESSAVLEVTEYMENERVRFVSDEGGIIWDTIFTLTEEYGKTHLELNMAVKPYKFKAKLMAPMIGGFVKKAIEADMQAVKEFCEAAA